MSELKQLQAEVKKWEVINKKISHILHTLDATGNRRERYYQIQLAMLASKAVAYIEECTTRIKQIQEEDKP